MLCILYIYTLVGVGIWCRFPVSCGSRHPFSFSRYHWGICRAHCRDETCSQRQRCASAVWANTKFYSTPQSFLADGIIIVLPCHCCRLALGEEGSSLALLMGARQPRLETLPCKGCVRNPLAFWCGTSDDANGGTSTRNDVGRSRRRMPVLRRWDLTGWATL